MEKSDVMKDALHMLKYYPLLLPSGNLKHWEGVVNIKGAEIFMNIDIPNYPSVKNAEIKCTTGFQSIINEIVTKLNKDEDKRLSDVFKLVQKSNILMPYYQQFCMNEDVNNLLNDCISFTDRYDKIIKELKLIGPDNVLNADERFTNLSLTHTDDTGFQHVIELTMASNYPASKPVLKQVDLPDVVVPKLISCRSVCEIYSKFCSIISDLQDFWSVYDSLRQNTWVIDPEHSTKKDVYCRIVVCNNVSILVTLNPLEVMSFPDIKFLGADRAVMPLRRKLEDNLKEFGWDMNSDFIENLLIILGIPEFPEQPAITNTQRIRNETKDDNLLVTEQECSICFTLRSDDNMLPTKICNNDKCTTVFHISCLAQWFQCVPTNEPSFNLISGDCPNCGKRILCPLNITD